MESRVKSSVRLGLGFLYVIHPRRAWPFPQTRSQSGQLLARSHGQDLDTAIVIVADPTGNLQDVRLTLDKPAEADALNSSAHQKAAGLSERLVFCGSHHSIAEIRGPIAEVRTSGLGFHLCNRTSDL